MCAVITGGNMSDNKITVSKELQAKLIDALTAELATLRAKAEISQGDLAALLGISRQTYSTIEGGSKKMSWGIYLSLLLYYDYNVKTHTMIRNIGAFPEELVRLINGGTSQRPYGNPSILPGIPENVTQKLDDQAFQAIRTVIMLEYARCENLSGDAVVKSFNGISFGRIESNPKADEALRAIKESRESGEV